MWNSTYKWLAGLMLCAAGCASADAATPAPAGPIEGREWRVTALRGVDAEALGTVHGAVYLRFADGRVQGFGGCNRLAGGYTLDGDRLTIAGLAGTMMACPPPAMGVENALTTALGAPLAVAVDGDSLRLTPPGEEAPAVILAAAPPPRLDGVAWQVTGYNNGRQAVVSPLADTSLSLTFADGTASGSAGCNTFRASYTLTGERLAIGAPATTRKRCPDAVMAQEREFLAALQTAVTWAVAGGALDLHRADGERVLHATPAP